MSKERPILFSGPMVHAILAGCKTQTRRVVKSSIVDFHTLEFMHLDHDESPWIAWFEKGRVQEWVRCPYGQVGDRLWVRERFGYCNGVGLTCGAIDATYVCFPDGSQQFRDSKIGYHQWNHPVNPGSWPSDWRWKPSIHMPRWASRITLEITDVRVERLNDISHHDALQEGLIEWSDPPRVQTLHYGLTNADVWETSAPAAFKRIWESINGAGSWSANPWVWILEFRKVA